MKTAKIKPAYKSIFDSMSTELIVKNVKDGLRHKLESEGFHINSSFYPIPSDLSGDLNFFIDLDSIKVESTDTNYQCINDFKKFESELKMIFLNINDEDMERQIELCFECYMIPSDHQMKFREHIFKASRITIFNDFPGENGGSIEKNISKANEKYISLAQTIAFTQELIANQITLLRGDLKNQFL